jgi:acetyl-CoA C-acetyltransferase
MKSIKDKVAIIGMGCTRFGERWEMSAEDLIVEAFLECLADAKIETGDIDAAFFGTGMPEVHLGKTAIPLAVALRLDMVPVTRVESLCTSGAESFRAACLAVASGHADMALALGAEKLKDIGYGGLPTWGSNLGSLDWLYRPRVTAVGAFAQLAVGYAAKWNVSLSDLKRAMLEVSVKSHDNAQHNEKAHLRKPIDRARAADAPYVAYPLALHDCCGVSDGAACALVTTLERAKELGIDRPITVKAVQAATSNGEEYGFTDWDYDSMPTAAAAAERAYAEASITDAFREIDLAELHDSFSITEIVNYEDLGFSKRGNGWKDVLDGVFHKDGALPCQTDGGLKCFGHPIGASGLRMIYELYLQLKGLAGKRQLLSPRLGLALNLGGYPYRSIAQVTILGRND